MVVENLVRYSWLVGALSAHVLAVCLLALLAWHCWLTYSTCSLAVLSVSLRPFFSSFFFFSAKLQMYLA